MPLVGDPLARLDFSVPDIVSEALCGFRLARRLVDALVDSGRREFQSGQPTAEQRDAVKLPGQPTAQRREAGLSPRDSSLHDTAGPLGESVPALPHSTKEHQSFAGVVML